MSWVSKFSWTWEWSLWVQFVGWVITLMLGVEFLSWVLSLSVVFVRWVCELSLNYSVDEDQFQKRVAASKKFSETSKDSPWKSSGAAYGGLPQNVSNLFPGVNSLLNPKSAILMFISLSKRRFSACNKIATLTPDRKTRINKTWRVYNKLYYL